MMFKVTVLYVDGSTGVYVTNAKTSFHAWEEAMTGNAVKVDVQYIRDTADAWDVV